MTVEHEWYMVYKCHKPAEQQWHAKNQHMQQEQEWHTISHFSISSVAVSLSYV